MTEKIIEEKTCPVCNKKFEKNKRQVYCSKTCSPHYKTYAERWLAKKDPKEKKKQIDSNQISFGATWKKSPPKNSVSIWRG